MVLAMIVTVVRHRANEGGTECCNNNGQKDNSVPTDQFEKWNMTAWVLRMCLWERGGGKPPAWTHGRGNWAGERLTQGHCQRSTGLTPGTPRFPRYRSAEMEDTGALATRGTPDLPCVSGRKAVPSAADGSWSKERWGI